MLKDITIGQYYPADSIVHKTDPRVKMILGFIYIIFLFIVSSFVGYGLVFLWILLATKISKIPVKLIVKGLKPLRWIILITFIINMLFTKGTVLYALGPIKVTEEGLYNASRMAVRLCLLVMGTSLTTLTTSPVALTDGIEGLFSPLKKIGFPAHELAMMITIALRFVPTLIDETDKIMKAQMARGADFESGNVIKRAKNTVPLIIPLLLSSINRADELAIAMEARCYHGDEGRTKLNPLKIDSRDIMVFVFTILSFVAIFFVERLV
ncbi:energy-coupling factor transporter transmembrane component T family protein [Neofamilia massiliensis]|uniref:energy-coupling factor transporter transmembrane component T family protein n=1 Tax=Neofamilia massiliensis TaxID=1673724 RepID=UPI0006BB7ED7|nr:energy-coupling factor transporter transmembrane component T [Neofamilia massiliensis]